MEHSGFVFYASFEDAIESLPEEKRYKACRMIWRYGLHGEMPDGIEDDYVLQVIFALVRPQIDANNQRRENAKKGGRPPKAAVAENAATADSETEKPTVSDEKPMVSEVKTIGFESENHRFQSEKPKVKEKVKEKAKEQAKEKAKDITPYSPPIGGMADNAADAEETSAGGHADAEQGEDGPEPATPLQERRFEEFWAAYPKKTGKGAARKAWMKIRPDSGLHAAIIESVRSNAEKNPQWLKDGGQYIPNPATWLNQERWEDGRPWESERASPDRTDINRDRQSQLRWLLDSIEEDERNDETGG